jgi:hypothetical protein
MVYTKMIASYVRVQVYTLQSSTKNIAEPISISDISIGDQKCNSLNHCNVKVHYRGAKSFGQVDNKGTSLIGPNSNSVMLQ